MNPAEEEVGLKFLEKKINIKIPVHRLETVEMVKRMCENILGIDHENNFDFYIMNFHVSEFFESMNLLDLLDEFNTREIEIKRKMFIPAKQRTSEEMIINPDILNAKDIEMLMEKLYLLEYYFYNLKETESELIFTLEDLNMLETNLQKYYASQDNIDTSFPDDSISLFSLLNKNSEDEIETGNLYYEINTSF
jgi:hypothetical protein